MSIPEYDDFVHGREAQALIETLRCFNRLHPADIRHFAWRRLIEGGSLEEVIASVPPGSGWQPRPVPAPGRPSYNEFVGAQGQDYERAYKAAHPTHNDPAPADILHYAYAVLVNGFTHEQMKRRLVAGDAAEPNPQNPPLGSNVPARGQMDGIHHRTDFLTLNANGVRFSTMEGVGDTPDMQKRMIDALHARGYTHAYVQCTNLDPYRDRTAKLFDVWEHDAHLLWLVSYLERLRAADITPVLWLLPNPSAHGVRGYGNPGNGWYKKWNPQYNDAPDHQLRRLETIVRATNHLVGCWCDALEYDEFFRHPKEKHLSLRPIEQRIDLLNALGAKQPKACHMRTGEHEILKSKKVDVLLYQAGFEPEPFKDIPHPRPKKPGEKLLSIKNVIKKRKAQYPGKHIVAAEYAFPGHGRYKGKSVAETERMAIECGKAALEGGASGFGNGGPRK